MLLVGSRALNWVRPELLKRIPQDWDFVCTIDQFEEFRKHTPQKELLCHPIDEGRKMLLKKKAYPGYQSSVQIFEFEIAWPGSTAEELLQLGIADRDKREYTSESWAASLDLLYTIKSTHKYKKNSPHFLKNRVDIEWMRSAGAKIRPEWMDWFKRREKETYNYKHPSLNQSKDQFFSGDGVTYVYDHDTIHQAMKHFDEPAYTYFKKDGAEVACDKDKFFSLEEKYRLASVLEESYVLAIERSLVPHPGVLTPKQAFDTALIKVCTSITSGWWREYAYDNFFKAVKAFDPKYAERFWLAVEAGIVKKI